MIKKILVLSMLVGGMISLSGCKQKPTFDGSFDFVIYEKDTDNSDLSDNNVIASYSIEYKGCKTVTDALIKKGSVYFFSESSPDYIILKDSAYGLSYTSGYFHDYSECSTGDDIDISWSYSAINGEMANEGISQTLLDGLVTYGLVINGWKD